MPGIRETTRPSLTGERVGEHAEAIGPDQGVIEEARRRQRRRRLRYVLAGSVIAIAIAAIAWMHGGGVSGASSGANGVAVGARVVDTSDAHAPAFNVRLVPTLRVAQTGWCVVVEEHGVSDGEACGGAALASSPFLQIYGWSKIGSGYATSVAVTVPSVAAVLLDGRIRVAPSALPGLPYGLRAARIVTRVPRGGRPFPAQTPIVALDGQGRQIPENRTTTSRQGTIRSWRFPARPPRGVCQLRVEGVPGLATSGGQVATSIRPFAGALVGDAFVACIDTEYRLRGLPIDAEILLDAAHPGVPVQALPDWKPVSGAPGFFSQGGLTAKRAAGAWLLVRQGRGLAQRMRLLRHLSASVEL